MVAWHVADNVSRHGGSMAGPHVWSSNESVTERLPLSTATNVCHISYSGRDDIIRKILIKLAAPTVDRNTNGCEVVQATRPERLHRQVELPMSSRRLDLAERYRLHALYEICMSMRAIAGAVTRAPSTISRELRRNQHASLIIGSLLPACRAISILQIRTAHSSEEATKMPTG